MSTSKYEVSRSKLIDNLHYFFEDVYVCSLTPNVLQMMIVLQLKPFDSLRVEALN